MIEQWREWLYPLGFAAQLVFGWRFLQQWLLSEMHHKSIVTKGFWRLSIVGNLLLLIHAFIQLQFHVCIVQWCNAVISWRNINLMQKTRRFSFKTVLILMMLSVALLTLIFGMQEYLFNTPVEWFRIPKWNGHGTQEVGLPMHLLGLLGMVLFSSRFWIQWFSSERAQKSQLNLPFWWLSLIGALLTCVYFLYIGDPVNLLGPAIGIIPYLRNILLIRRFQPDQGSI